MATPLSATCRSKATGLLAGLATSPRPETYPPTSSLSPLESLYSISWPSASISTLGPPKPLSPSDSKVACKFSSAYSPAAFDVSITRSANSSPSSAWAFCISPTSETSLSASWAILILLLSLTSRFSKPRGEYQMVSFDPESVHVPDSSTLTLLYLTLLLDSSVRSIGSVFREAKVNWAFLRLLGG